MASLYGLLDVLIVLCGIYSGLSCVVSWTNERLAEFLSLRGKTLYSGVLNLVLGEVALANRIFEHPLILAARSDPGGKPNLTKPYRPSYLDARNFSLALWQTLDRRRGTEADEIVAVVVPVPAQTLMIDLTDRVEGLRNADLRQALSALVQQAGNDYERLLAATDGWFNAQMDRVSGWYKRRSQYIVAAIAFVIVFISGLDSVEIATRLSVNPALSDVLAGELAHAVQPAGSTPHASGDAPAPQALAGAARALDMQAQIDFASFFHLRLDGTKWRHLPGMFVTLLALTLGGPFWFDLLGSLVNVRAAGRKPKRRDQPPR